MRQAALVSTLVLVAAAATAQPPTYVAKEIPSPTPYFLLASALNNKGQVVGYFAVGSFIPHTGTPAHAFLYSDGVVTDLFPNETSANFSEATAVNNLGQVVGYRRWDVMSAAQPFVYENGQTTLLDPFATGLPWFAVTGAAQGINDAGQIVGSATDSLTSFGHAFLLSPPATPAEDLHPPGDPYYWSTGVAINTSGQVVGTMTKVGQGPLYDIQDSFLWDGQGFSYLDDLLNGASFSPGGINGAGRVAGTASGVGQPVRAMVYADGEMIELSGLSGASASRAYGLNAEGDVVGSSTPVGGSRAVVWRDGVPYDLNDRLAQDPGTTLQEARGINDVGQIVAWGAEAVAPGETARIRSFLLTPITAATALEELVKLVLGMGLPHGIENSLIAKLTNAEAALAAGDSTSACVDLSAFMNEVEAQRGKKISNADADAAIAKAALVRQLLGC